MRTVEFFQRRAGILLHPTSLPSGKLDKDVFHWIDFLAEAGFSCWQVLPLGEPDAGMSPYQCISAFAMNPALLSDYPVPDIKDPGFLKFCEKHSFWLHDYALFDLLKKQTNGLSWVEWPHELKTRDPRALAEIVSKSPNELYAAMWKQYVLFKRWQEIHTYAQEQGILLFGDMPVFVSHDCADVWAHPGYFLLDEKGMPGVVTGVPPDYFSETGQHWGNPHYNWDVMQQDNYSWWMARTHHHLEQFDLIRIDHFRGLESVWMIDARSDSATDGYWKHTPGDMLLGILNDELEHLPIVAEDLGIITEEVIALRKKYHLPGMAVLQFGFDHHSDNPHKPDNIAEDCVVYTGTHDNDTTKGWFESINPHEQAFIKESLGVKQDIDVNSLVDAMINEALNSRASLCVIPLQDYLHLNSSARTNIPGTTENNWLWSFDWQDIPDDFAIVMYQRIQKADRIKTRVRLKAIV